MNGFGFDHKAAHWEHVDVDAAYRLYYAQMLSLAESGLFTGLAHPDSIKCFGHKASYDLTRTYELLADALITNGVYAEQSCGLHNNYGAAEKGMNPDMLAVFLRKGVKLRSASDAHCPEDVGKGLVGLRLA